jgi:hypothetical protein
MAKKAGPAGEIWAYEANPIVTEFAKVNALLNPYSKDTMKVFNGAISDVNDEEIVFDFGAGSIIG